MWERPEDLWRRLRLGREEFLQRLITTLVVGGDPPPWNEPRMPSPQGVQFLQELDGLAHRGESAKVGTPPPDAFVDEYLLPKLDESAQNGWPDWAVLWAHRVWVIELKTEPGSHRDDQLPYYLRLATAAHPRSTVDLTYITGPLEKPAPAVLPGQRYSHVEWKQVLPLIESTWGADSRDEVTAYVSAVRTVVDNLSLLHPAQQRAALVGELVEASPPSPAPVVLEEPGPNAADPTLVDLARATAADGQQRGVGADSPSDLEGLRDAARAEIDALPTDDSTRFVLPWLWDVRTSTGRALTPEGEEFGYELRFSRYETIQVLAGAAGTPSRHGTYRRSDPERPIRLCPTHHMELSATGVCALCD